MLPQRAISAEPLILNVLVVVTRLSSSGHSFKWCASSPSSAEKRLDRVIFNHFSICCCSYLLYAHASLQRRTGVLVSVFGGHGLLRACDPGGHVAQPANIFRFACTPRQVGTLNTRPLHGGLSPARNEMILHENLLQPGIRLVRCTASVESSVWNASHTVTPQYLPEGARQHPVPELMIPAACVCHRLFALPSASPPQRWVNIAFN